MQTNEDLLHKSYAKIAVCQLNQWAMSFRTNQINIIKSIKMCKQQGVTYRLGPEMEVPGYSCEDHFFESDTVLHSWQVLHEILADSDLTRDILCDIGMPVIYQSTLYNCRVYKRFSLLDLRYTWLMEIIIERAGGLSRGNMVTVLMISSCRWKFKELKGKNLYPLELQ